MTAFDGLEASLQEFRSTFPIAEFARDGITWRYRRGGAGAAPLLWLTGALGVGEFSFVYAHHFATDCRVYIPDYPPVCKLDVLVDGLAALLDSERMTAAHVVGGSFGGMLAQQLVRRHPQRVRSLVLSHTAPPQPSRARSTLIRSVARLSPQPLLRAMFRRRLRVAFLKADPFWLRFFDTAVDNMNRRDLVSRILLANEFLQLHYTRQDLQNWPGRVLLLDAEDDTLMPAQSRPTLRSLYPQAETHTFSGTGHAAAILHPEQYAGVISRFLVGAA